LRASFFLKYRAKFQLKTEVIDSKELFSWLDSRSVVRVGAVCDNCHRMRQFSDALIYASCFISLGLESMATMATFAAA
jgi:hypothetical protein